MPHVTKGLLISGLCALILSACGGMPSQTPAPTASLSERVRVAYVQPSSNQAPAWTAKEGGIFPKYGLDADLTYIQGSSTAISAMVMWSRPCASETKLSLRSAVHLMGRRSLPAAQVTIASSA